MIRPHSFPINTPMPPRIASNHDAKNHKNRDAQPKMAPSRYIPETPHHPLLYPQSKVPRTTGKASTPMAAIPINAAKAVKNFPDSD